MCVHHVLIYYIVEEIVKIEIKENMKNKAGDMGGKILIVEDEFIIASDLRMILEKAGYDIAGIAPSVQKALEIINLKRPAWVFLDIYLSGKRTGIDLAKKLLEMSIPFIYVSANSNQSVLNEASTTRPYGFLVKPFREQDVLVTLDVAKYRHENDLEAQLQSEIALKEQVMRIFAETISKEEEISKIITALQYHIPFDFFTIDWKNKNGQFAESRAFTKYADGHFELISEAELFQKLNLKTGDLASSKKFSSRSTKSACLSGVAFVEMCRLNSFDRSIANGYDLHAALIKTFAICSWGQLNFSLYSRDSDGFKQQNAALLDRLDLLLVRISDYFPQISKLGRVEAQDIQDEGLIIDPIPVASVSTADAINSESFGLIGDAPNFAKVKEQITTVAPFDISVLILGESGTGKERVARAVHNLSARKNKPFIKVNCAAIPETLIESELFGYEKGAFTGAADRRIGKFEQANGGTIFLDEIGEIPLDLQVKLLCVLQEREVVRLGGNQIIKIDVRIVAATNRNLEKAIANGEFRLDLYYRLNVFPILMPPLRHRKEDIPALVGFFIDILTKRMGTNNKTITDDAMQTLLQYNWPGNIRELENIIERNLVLNKGNVIHHIELPENRQSGEPEVPQDRKIKTIKELEKEHIIATLEYCKGKVSGSGGAAELLDIPPNTLFARLKKLGIAKTFES